MQSVKRETCSHNDLASRVLALTASPCRASHEAPMTWLLWILGQFQSSWRGWKFPITETRPSLAFLSSFTSRGQDSRCRRVFSKHWGICAATAWTRYGRESQTQAGFTECQAEPSSRSDGTRLAKNKRHCDLYISEFNLTKPCLSQAVEDVPSLVAWMIPGGTAER